MIDFNNSLIEVQSFGVVAEVIHSDELELFGDQGYDLINSWKLNVEDYGPNMKYYIFSRPE